ncbi:hypothetical protein ABT121_44285 [Streptomyces sp. NPDC001928]|uniref:hypothetical protein n=1 Tax=Streptomyces sp. NPDC001928 TaxID=3154404 RepID=UPI00331C75DF
MLQLLLDACCSDGLQRRDPVSEGGEMLQQLGVHLGAVSPPEVVEGNGRGDPVGANAPFQEQGAKLFHGRVALPDEGGNQLVRADRVPVEQLRAASIPGPTTWMRGV